MSRQPFTSIVPRFRGRVQPTPARRAKFSTLRASKSACRSVFPPVNPPDASAPVGVRYPFAPSAERRVLTMRRGTLMVGRLRVRPHVYSRFVSVRRLSDVGLPTDDQPAYLTSATSCSCDAAKRRPYAPCLHRRVLQHLGGIPGFYARIAAQLENPHLVRCCVCLSLLDGHYDDLRRAYCLDCETQGETR